MATLHDPMRSCLLAIASVVLTLAACGDTNPTDTNTDGCKVADSGRLTLVAKDTRWDTDCLEAAEGRLVIEVDNRDDGVSHNVHLSDAPGSPASELRPGPSTQQLDVSLEAGTYEFVCDLHPNMVGTLTVE